MNERRVKTTKTHSINTAIMFCNHIKKSMTIPYINDSVESDKMTKKKTKTKTKQNKTMIAKSKRRKQNKRRQNE